MIYEDVVSEICGDNWYSVNKQEREGGLGVACAFAIIDNDFEPTIENVAAFLASHPKGSVKNSIKRSVPEMIREITVPFNRLQFCGVFSRRYNIKEDRDLNFLSNDRNKTRNAWCILAGYAGGLTGFASC